MPGPGRRVDPRLPPLQQRSRVDAGEGPGGQPRLVTEAAEDRDLVDPGLTRDLAAGDPFQAMLKQQLQEGGGDALLGCRGPQCSKYLLALVRATSGRGRPRAPASDRRRPRRGSRWTPP